MNQATDEEFTKQIDSFIDVDAFLRFLAANALTSNLESFFALGHNYTLYLDPKTNKFHFIPGDLEFSLANFLLMGSPDQLMDLSVTKPYPGENKLPDRLLAIKEVNAEVSEAAQGAVRDRVHEGATAQGRRGDRQGDEGRFARRRRRRSRRERNRRRASAGRAERARSRRTSRRSPRSGPRRSRRNSPARARGTSRSRSSSAHRRAAGRGRQSRSRSTSRRSATSVKVPPEFDATLFAAPPRVNYPVAIACEPSGAVYVAVDEQGSLGRTPGGGRILRCVDKDGDGKVDDVTVFAKVDHPRGVVYRDGKVWVMHPPTLYRLSRRRTATASPTGRTCSSPA